MKSVLLIVTAAVFVLRPCAGCSGRSDTMTEVAPGTFLSWDGRTWSLLDDTLRTPGVESSGGGTVIVASVSRIAVSSANGRVFGIDGSGKYFVVNVSPNGADEVQTYENETAFKEYLLKNEFTVPSFDKPECAVDNKARAKNSGT